MDAGNNSNNKKIFKAILMMMILLVFCVLIISLIINIKVISSARGRICSLDNKFGESKSAILVLGAGVRKNGTPSIMLEDRLIAAAEMYEAGYSDKIIVSGDHSSDDYDEVGVMKDYLIAKGVPSEKIYKDHAGFSTYDSIYRAKAIFGADSLLIITQRYHLFRAMYIADELGVDASGCQTSIIATDAPSYAKQPIYSFREYFARIKDYFFCKTKPKPKYLGDYIGLEVSGDVTDCTSEN